VVLVFEIWRRVYYYYYASSMASTCHSAFSFSPTRLFTSTTMLKPSFRCYSSITTTNSTPSYNSLVSEVLFNSYYYAFGLNCWNLWYFVCSVPLNCLCTTLGYGRFIPFICLEY
jgi:hypothetical protein